jgi:hypothetical protein
MPADGMLAARSHEDFGTSVFRGSFEKSYTHYGVIGT